MDISVHSWQIGVKKMCISKGNSYIRQMQRTYRKVLHEIYPNVSKFFPCFFCFCFCFCFQITFDLLLTNTSRLNTLKYTDQPIWFDFYWWSRAKQTTNSNMVWYLNMNTSTYSYWSKDVGENLPSAMHLLGVGVMGVLSLGSFSQIACLCSFIIDTYFVHNPSK